MSFLKKLFAGSAGKGPRESAGAGPSSPHCAVCGRELSGAPADRGSPLGLLIAQGGMYCRNCGKRYCFECAPKDTAGTLVCTCGANLTAYGL